MNLCGIIFARKECAPLSDTSLTHESVHTAQIIEMLVVGFYVAYVFEWLVRLIGLRVREWRRGNLGSGRAICRLAYLRISFEVEARRGALAGAGYLSARRAFAMWR